MKDFQKDLRKSLELQFRNLMEQKLVFPYFQSLGIKHIFQGFEYEGKYIGVLHLYFVYLNWESEWINSPLAAIKLAREIQDDKPYNEDLLIQANINFIKSKYIIQTEKEIPERLI